MTASLATSFLERSSEIESKSSEIKSSMTKILTNAAVAGVTAVAYVDTEAFAARVEQASGLVLVDFTADWCPPCRRLAPDLDALANEYGDSLTVVKVDADEQPGLTARFGVRSLPTLMFFRGGQVVDRIVGAPPPAQLRAKVDEFAAQPR
jgi:thioredoxin 1